MLHLRQPEGRTAQGDIAMTRKGNTMDLSSRFNEALFKTTLGDVPGAAELWSLFNTLADDAEGDELMGKLDAYISDTSDEVQALYRSIMRRI